MFTNSGITAAYVGSNSVSKLYLGSTLIWPLTPVETYTFVKSLWSSGDTVQKLIHCGNVSSTTTMEMDFTGRVLAYNSGVIFGGTGATGDDNDYRCFYTQAKVFLDMKDKRISTGITYSKIRKIHTSNFAYTVTQADASTVTLTGATVSQVPNLGIVVNVRGLVVENFTLTDNGVIVFQGVPAVRDSDGYIGLYDQVSQTFFPADNQNNLYVDYYPVPPEPYSGSGEYLTFKIISGGTLEGYGLGGMLYRLNGGEWLLSTNNFSLPFIDGDVVEVKSDRYFIERFTSGSTAVFNIFGNVLSAIWGDSASTRTDTAILPRFTGTKVVSAEYLLMPSVLLSGYSCSDMFQDCTLLTKAPELPATSLTKSCYSNMFRGCTSLTTAPVLPATALAESCYENMFYGCTSLTAAPELPVATLQNHCYSSMFQGCSSLNYIKCLATIDLDKNATNMWVWGVASSGTFIKKAGETWPSGSSGIPNNWTVIEE